MSRYFAQLFNANCASCHSWTSVMTDKAGGYPVVRHNSAAGSADATNFTMVILNGVHPRSASGFMPAFRAELNDPDIAALSNYIRTQFDNLPTTQTAEGVAKQCAAG